MPTAIAVKEINTLLKDLDTDDYPIVIDYIKLLAQNRKKQRSLETIAAMNEFQSVIGSDKGWNSEEEMIKDMANFRKSRMETYKWKLCWIQMF